MFVFIRTQAKILHCYILGVHLISKQTFHIQSINQHRLNMNMFFIATLKGIYCSYFWTVNLILTLFQNMFLFLVYLYKCLESIILHD